MSAAIESTIDLAKLRSIFGTALAEGVANAALVRFDNIASRLFSALHQLYPENMIWADQWLSQIAECINARPEQLKRLDLSRSADWLKNPKLIGYSAYVDRFAGNLQGVQEKIDYLQSLGIGYLHLLPFLTMREGDSDGGFAVKDYEQVDPRFGSNADLIVLTEQLRSAGISLCSDLVLNHCADDHVWAIAARNGDQLYRDFFYTFSDRSLPDRYEQHLGQVFPVTAPGNFSAIESLGWVWTTFYPYQWDLNWRNPHVFAAMSLNMLRLANMGIEIFRLDSTAYLWKQLGTSCMNLPQTHRIVQALRAVIDIAAPSVALKAEAIVPMEQLPPYFGSPENHQHECKLAYHSSLMAACWAGLVTQRADIPANVIARTPDLPSDSNWLNYVRCHDDIGWGVLSAEAHGQTGIESFDLGYVSDYLAGHIIGSPARGASFQTAADNGVHGSNGMTAALVGIDLALANNDSMLLEQSIDRLLLLYGVMLCLPGIPLIYMGDELALGNDESFRSDPSRANEGRWLQRPMMDWVLTKQRNDRGTVANRVFAGLKKMIDIRCSNLSFIDAGVSLKNVSQLPVLFLQRGNLQFVFNFSAQPQLIRLGQTKSIGSIDLLSGQLIDSIDIPAYGQYWLQMNDTTSA